MNNSFSLVFGGVIAYILLLLYSGTVLYMSKTVIIVGSPSILRDGDGNLIPTRNVPFPSGLTLVVTTIGGLVSALVVAKLALTPPGTNPATVELSSDASDSAKKLASILTTAFLLGWLATGLTALIVGVMIYGGANSSLADIGTNWLGVAVASGYAYFGIKPR